MQPSPAPVLEETLAQILREAVDTIFIPDALPLIMARISATERIMPVHDDSEKLAQDWIFNSPDSILACRGQGHAWPKLRPGRMPKGMSALPQREGGYQLITTCRDCGMERTLITLPSGEIDMPARYAYRQPDGYKAPKGTHVTRRECLAESWRRMREEITSSLMAAQKTGD